MELQKASNKVSPEKTAEIRSAGRALVYSMSILLKVTRLYATGHKHVLSGLADLRNLLEGLLEREGDSHLSRVDDYLFLNDIRLTVDFRSYQGFQYVIEVLKERGFAEIAFSPGVELEEL